MPRKNPLKTYLRKNENDDTKCIFYVLLSWNLPNQKYFFEGKIFIFAWKKKITWKPLTSQKGIGHKKLFWNEKKHVWNERIYIKLFLTICTRANSSHPVRVFFRWNFTLIAATVTFIICRSALFHVKARVSPKYFVNGCRYYRHVGV